MATRQDRPEEPEWLTLREAARRLKVHTTTLRRWADEGQIPVMLTPGGHRRFAASDIAHLTERRHTIRRFGPVERVWAREALELARKRVGERQGESWLDHLDETARAGYRQMGQALMELTRRHLTAEEEDEANVKEARRLGHEYGRHTRDAGMALTQALRASMFFRDALLAAAVQLPGNIRIPTESQARMLARIHAILDAVQLGVAEQYDNAAKG